MDILLFLVSIAIGGIAAWQIFNWMYGKKLRDNKDQLRQESTLLLERIEKVFKVVVAEGYFTEIYDHNSRKEFLGFFNVNKKALVISRAKVSVGFDFGRMKVKRDETSRKLIIEEFPEAEVLSIDTDYKFYDINQGWLNKFNHEDYTNILNEAKKVMQDKALTSDLPKVANRQVGLMMTQLAASMNWEVEFKQLPQSKPKELSEFVEFQEVQE
ncbi:DUF4230 domain-containing protein [Emticicia sp. SJ17W-69]|uniref:DUF4230 domain-containing protein n=1 Tax=Emticicia sp. SJ17W-69 TaxID=3421657 RepID=UPI003EB821AE